MEPINALRIAVIYFCALSLAGCGGAGGIPAAPIAVAATAAPQDHTFSVIALGPNDALTVSGNIVGMLAHGVQIQGGRSIGYFDVYTSPSTVVSGPKPFVGEVIEASGTGTTQTSLSANSVMQVLQATGPVIALKSGGFQINAGSGSSSLNIWTKPSTQYTGSKPYIGETLRIQGTGSLTTSLTALTVVQTGAASPSPAPSVVPSPAPVPRPSPVPTTAPTSVPQSGAAEPPALAFMPSSWGKIAAMQVFDDTSNGYVPKAAAAANGWRYAAVWGARNNIGTAWLTSNPALKTAYYDALETDESSTSWGAIGHTLSWWQSNRPNWVLYACTRTGGATKTPAWVPGLSNNVPLDVHNPAVVNYQVRLMANYAHALGYRALAIDEATFWQADRGVSGGYGCGIYQNGAFVRRYSGIDDPNWASDVVQWVRIAHALLTTDPAIAPYHLNLIVNHPADQLTANETTFLANVDADLDETGYSDYGRPLTGSASAFTMRTDWATYAQAHGVAVLMNQNWGSAAVGAPQLDYSVATYLMGNRQAEALFASPGAGYGTEQWHSQYASKIGAPCGAYYSAGDASNPSIYYRRFANAIVVVNGGSGSNNEVAHLPGGHTYADIFGRAVSPALTIASNDGYVLLTQNGCR